MKKVVAFLLTLIIFVVPITTLVKADVVIGDNDETIINENATILGRKLALMESFSDLALSGVTEFTISNTNDVDTYLDYLWEELDDAIESLSDGTGFTEISNTLKSKYFTNLVQYKDYIINRGNYLAQMLPTGSPITTLLSTFFSDNIYGKQTTTHYDLSLDMFRALSRYSNNEEPTYDVPSEYQSFIDFMNKRSVNHEYQSFWFYDLNEIINKDKNYYWKSLQFPWSDYSYYVPYNQNYNFNVNQFYVLGMKRLPIQDIYINSNGNGTYTYNLSFTPYSQVIGEMRKSNDSMNVAYNGVTIYNSTSWEGANNNVSTSDSYTGSLNQVFNRLIKSYKNVNIYVDNVPWSIVGSILNPTLDIDGYLKIYGNNEPVQYELQPNTQIDYDQLYQVIYNAIRDNLPISQGDINYYDSHDTIYSPTIINNYGEEEGDESDLIDTILDYAVIPKFDTAIAQPMRQALTNGVVIMNTSITDVIPNEILLILGACFFLLLFAVVINRMIK